MKTLIKQPTFLVIGAQKCGTTWLAEMVSQHPEVAVGNVKELNFFNKVPNYRKGLTWYEDQFDVAETTKAMGEFTPNYFWTSNDDKEITEEAGTKDIPQLVHEAYPELKLIVCLRNPVDRAVSAYYHHIRNGRIKPSQNILEAADSYGIESMGYYDLHLENWLEYFDFDKFLFLVYEDDLQDQKKEASLEKVFNHIGVSSDFCPADIFTKYNSQNSHFDMRTRHYPASIKNILHRVLPTRFTKSKIWDIKVTEKEKLVLAKRFDAHNKNIEKMIGRTLNW